MATADDLRNQVLSLPACDRAVLARELLLSLESAEFESDVERAWIDEVGTAKGNGDQRLIRLVRRQPATGVSL